MNELTGDDAGSAVQQYLETRKDIYVLWVREYEEFPGIYFVVAATHKEVYQGMPCRYRYITQYVYAVWIQESGSVVVHPIFIGHRECDDFDLAGVILMPNERIGVDLSYTCQELTDFEPLAIIRERGK